MLTYEKKQHSIDIFMHDMQACVSLEKQCGTSVEMIDRTNSHFLPTRFRQEFSGMIYRKKEPDSLKRRKISEKTKSKNIKNMNGWL